jgi:hypothetical protein
MTQQRTQYCHPTPRSLLFREVQRRIGTRKAAAETSAFQVSARIGRRPSPVGGLCLFLRYLSPDLDGQSPAKVSGSQSVAGPRNRAKAPVPRVRVLGLYKLLWVCTSCIVRGANMPADLRTATLTPPFDGALRDPTLAGRDFTDDDFGRRPTTDSTPRRHLTADPSHGRIRGGYDEGVLTD